MLKCIFKFLILVFLDSNENYMTMKIFRITVCMYNGKYQSVLSHAYHIKYPHPTLYYYTIPCPP